MHLFSFLLNVFFFSTLYIHVFTLSTPISITETNCIDNNENLLERFIRNIIRSKLLPEWNATKICQQLIKEGACYDNPNQIKNVCCHTAHIDCPYLFNATKHSRLNETDSVHLRSSNHSPHSFEQSTLVDDIEQSYETSSPKKRFRRAEWERVTGPCTTASWRSDKGVHASFIALNTAFRRHQSDSQLFRFQSSVMDRTPRYLETIDEFTLKDQGYYANTDGLMAEAKYRSFHAVKKNPRTGIKNAFLINNIRDRFGDIKGLIFADLDSVETANATISGLLVGVLALEAHDRLRKLNECLTPLLDIFSIEQATYQFKFGYRPPVPMMLPNIMLNHIITMLKEFGFSMYRKMREIDYTDPLPNVSLEKVMNISISVAKQVIHDNSLETILYHPYNITQRKIQPEYIFAVMDVIISEGLRCIKHPNYPLTPEDDRTAEPFYDRPELKAKMLELLFGIPYEDNDRIFLDRKTRSAPLIDGQYLLNSSVLSFSTSNDQELPFGKLSNILFDQLYDSPYHNLTTVGFRISRLAYGSASYLNTTQNCLAPLITLFRSEQQNSLSEQGTDFQLITEKELGSRMINTLYRLSHLIEDGIYKTQYRNISVQLTTSDLKQLFVNATQESINENNLIQFLPFPGLLKNNHYTEQPSAYFIALIDAIFYQAAHCQRHSLDTAPGVYSNAHHLLDIFKAQNKTITNHLTDHVTHIKNNFLLQGRHLNELTHDYPLIATQQPLPVLPSSNHSHYHYFNHLFSSILESIFNDKNVDSHAIGYFLIDLTEAAANYLNGSVYCLSPLTTTLLKHSLPHFSQLKVSKIKFIHRIVSSYMINALNQFSNLTRIKLQNYSYRSTSSSLTPETLQRIILISADQSIKSKTLTHVLFSSYLNNKFDASSNNHLDISYSLLIIDTIFSQAFQCQNQYVIKPSSFDRNNSLAQFNDAASVLSNSDGYTSDKRREQNVVLNSNQNDTGSSSYSTRNKRSTISTRTLQLISKRRFGSLAGSIIDSVFENPDSHPCATGWFFSHLAHAGAQFFQTNNTCIIPLTTLFLSEQESKVTSEFTFGKLSTGIIDMLETFSSVMRDGLKATSNSFSTDCMSQNEFESLFLRAAQQSISDNQFNNILLYPLLENESKTNVNTFVPPEYSLSLINAVLSQALQCSHEHTHDVSLRTHPSRVLTDISEEQANHSLTLANQMKHRAETSSSGVNFNLLQSINLDRFGNFSGFMIRAIDNTENFNAETKGLFFSSTAILTARYLNESKGCLIPLSTVFLSELELYPPENISDSGNASSFLQHNLVSKMLHVLNDFGNVTYSTLKNYQLDHSELVMTTADIVNITVETAKQAIQAQNLSEILFSPYLFISGSETKTINDLPSEYILSVIDVILSNGIRCLEQEIQFHTTENGDSKRLSYYLLSVRASAEQLLGKYRNESNADADLQEHIHTIINSGSWGEKTVSPYHYIVKSFEPTSCTDQPPSYTFLLQDYFPEIICSDVLRKYGCMGRDPLLPLIDIVTACPETWKATCNLTHGSSMFEQLTGPDGQLLYNEQCFK